MSRSSIALLCLLLALASAGLAWWVGVSHGEAKARAKQDAQLVANLSSLIDASADLTKRANAASRDLRRTLGARQAVNQSTTKELSDALAPTAVRRTDCVLPADGVHILTQARNRAAAAAASGLAAGLPATGASATGR